jgi:hypothetical protein
MIGWGSISTPTATGKASSSSTLMTGFNADLTIPILVGGRFPGKEGGGWTGLRLEPTGGVMFMNMTVSGSSDVHGTLFGYRVGGTAAFQYLKFGRLDEKTLKQKGWGIAVGGFAGAQGTGGSMTISGAPSPYDHQDIPMSTNGSYGPSVVFSLPEYNAGTAKYTATNIVLMVLPTGDNTFAILQAAFTF